jgi:phasin family protein
MANQHSNKQTVDRSIEEATRRMSEQANRATGITADIAEQTARANVHLLQNGVETARQLWQCGTDMTSSFASRTAEQFGRSLGLAGNEAEAATGRSSQAVAAIVQSSQPLNDGYRKVSEEWFKLARSGMERAFDHLDEAWRSRNPQELAAIQTEALRDHLESLVQSTQRIAQLSQQTADEASRKLSEATRRAA